MRTSLGFLVFGAAVSAAGCYSDNGPYYADNGGYPPDYGQYCSQGVRQESIDTGATLDLDPGVGAGVTAEYLGDGAWRVATACDTAKSGYACHWDILVTPLDGAIQDFAPEGLERNDTLDRYASTQDGPEDSVRLVATDDYDIDAFTLDATPGSALEIDVILDGECGGTFLSWSEGGHIVSSDTQATDLTPSGP